MPKKIDLEQFKTPETKGFSGVAEDALEGLYAVPGAAGEIAKQLPGEVFGAFKQRFTHPLRFPKNLLVGLATTGQGLLNAPSNIGNYLAKKGFISEELAAEIPRKKEYDYAKALGLGKRIPGDLLFQSLPETPFWMARGGSSLPAKTAIQAGKFTGLGAMHNINPATLAGIAALPEAAEGLASLKDSVKGLGVTIPENIQEIQRLAKEQNVPLGVGDVTPTGSAGDKAATLGKKLGITEKGEQQLALKGSAENILENQKREMIQENFAGKNGLSKIEQIAKAGGRRSEAANSLLEDIAASGEDWNTILKTSGNTKLLLNKLKADSLYDNVEKLAANFGDVEFSSAVRAIDKNIEELSKTPKLNSNEIKILQDLKSDLTGASGFNFSQARAFRSDLNSKIADYMSGQNALVGKRGVKALQKVRGAIETDLNKFVQKGGEELRSTWKEADKYYKENLIPFRDRQLVKALKAESNPDEVFKMFIKSGGAEGDFGTGRSLKFYKALDDKGRAAVRYGILKQAADAAFNENGFSPAKFASQLEKLAASREVFFTGAANAEVKGIAKLMRHLSDAGSLKEPLTGYANYPLIATVAALTSGKGLEFAGGWIALKGLLTTKAGRNALIKLSYLKPGTKAFNEAIGTTEKILRKNMKMDAGFAQLLSQGANELEEKE